MIRPAPPRPAPAHTYASELSCGGCHSEAHCEKQSLSGILISTFLSVLQYIKETQKPGSKGKVSLNKINLLSTISRNPLFALLVQRNHIHGVRMFSNNVIEFKWTSCHFDEKACFFLAPECNISQIPRDIFLGLKSYVKCREKPRIRPITGGNMLEPQNIPVLIVWASLSDQ